MGTDCALSFYENTLFCIPGAGREPRGEWEMQTHLLMRAGAPACQGEPLCSEGGTQEVE